MGQKELSYSINGNNISVCICRLTLPKKEDAQILNMTTLWQCKRFRFLIQSCEWTKYPVILLAGEFWMSFSVTLSLSERKPRTLEYPLLTRGLSLPFLLICVSNPCYQSQFHCFAAILWKSQQMLTNSVLSQQIYPKLKIAWKLPRICWPYNTWVKGEFVMAIRRLKRKFR